MIMVEQKTLTLLRQLRRRLTRQSELCQRMGGCDWERRAVDNGLPLRKVRARFVEPSAVSWAPSRRQVSPSMAASLRPRTTEIITSHARR